MQQLLCDGAVSVARQERETEGGWWGSHTSHTELIGRQNVAIRHKSTFDEQLVSP